MKKFFILFILLALIPMVSFAQNISSKRFKKPLMIIDVIGGVNIPVHDFKGSFIDEIYNFQSYAANLGFSTGVNIKLAVATLDVSQFRLTLNMAYSHYVNSENAAYKDIYSVPVGWPKPPNYVYPVRIGGTSSVRYNIPYVALGFEYAIFVDPLLRSSFTFGTEVNMSIITGRVFNQPWGMNESFNTYHGNLRLGFGGNIAYNYRFAPEFGITVGMKYQLMNLLLRSSQETDESGYLYLNDSGDQSINQNLSSSRIMGNFSFFGGFNFYIGQRK
ncbi:MAG: hypothetical protein N2490_05005 [Ignavibacteria bacterium]|nr:hypothetical protein [Ignavibacteria bacterium]